MKKNSVTTLLLLWFTIIYGQAQGSQEVQNRYINFTETLSAAIDTNNLAVLGNAFNDKALIKRVLEPSKSDDTQRYNDGFERGLMEEGIGNIFVSALQAEVDNGSYYNMVKLHYKNNTPHVLLRIIDTAGALNYHDYELQLLNDVVKIVDVYIYISGEYFSETLKSVYLMGLKEVSGAKKMLAPSFIKSMENITRMKEMIERADYEKAVSIYDELPTKLRRKKMTQLLYIRAVSNLSDKRYLKALKRYKKSFPNDPSLNLLGFDLFFLRQEYDKTLVCINQLDKTIGGDPILNLYRGALYLETNEQDKALKSFEKLVDEAPYFELGYWTLFGYYLNNQNDKKAVDVLDLISKKLGYEKWLISLVINSDYPEFSESDAYKNWTKNE